MTTGTRHPRLPPLVRQTVDAFADGVRGHFGARLIAVRLFGSYARGEAHEDSDVDCLVLIDRLEPEDDRFVTDLAADLIWQLGGIVVSPLVMSPSQFERWKGTERQTPLSLARADESLRAARTLLDAALLADAESRVSYAAYQAVVALTRSLRRRA